VAERKLDLVELGAALVRQLGEGAAEVVGGEMRDADTPAVFEHGFMFCGSSTSR
jgi:hypothetical protein